MLSVGRLTPPPLQPLCVKRPTTINHSFICPELQHNHTCLLVLKRTRFCLFALKKQQNLGLSRNKLEKQDFDDGFEVDDDDDELDDVDDEVDEEDDELMVPFHKMDEWLKKKPKGFGEGKVYDTSIEDKLLEELEKSREAQLANIDKLKNEAKVLETKKELKEVKASEVAPGCVRVRINNLPKKKNIHRDLKSAFEKVHGIANILPAVSGTKKTRDPVCKGFAFVDFKSLEDANSFVQLFSGQNIAFGKTKKRIKCEIVKLSDASNGGSVQDGYNVISKSSITVLEEGGDQVDDIEELDPQLDSWEDDDFDELDEDFDDEEIVRNFKSLNFMKQSDIESLESRLLKKSLDSLPTKPKEKRFAQLFSGQNIAFGKTEKRIKCEIVKSSDASNGGSVQDEYNIISKSSITVLEEGGNQVDDIEEFDPQLNSLEDDDFDELDEDFDDEEIIRNFRSLNSRKLIDIESAESRLLEESFDSLPNKQKEERVGKKKPVLKKKPNNAKKMKVPGSARRLKAREKAKLAEVYSRYGVKQEPLASKET